MVELDGENRGVGRASGSPPRTPNLPFREAVGGVCPLGHGGGGGVERSLSLGKRPRDVFTPRCLAAPGTRSPEGARGE
jgi:hypothetical protein